MIKAIIFDMDGVIVDSESYQFEAFRKLFLEYGIDLTKDKFQWTGKTAKENIEDVLIKNNLNEDLSMLVERRRKIYMNLIKKNIKPIAGAIEAINTLSKKYTLAIASSSVMKIIEPILNALGIKEKFKVVVSGDQVKRGKPDPEIFLRTLEKLRLSAEECLVIEDAQTGVEAAYKAGIKCIAVPNEYTKQQDFSKAIKIINSLNELRIQEIDKI